MPPNAIDTSRISTSGAPRLVASISLPQTNLKLPPGLLPYFNPDALDYNFTSFARSSDGVTLCFGESWTGLYPNRRRHAC